MRQRDWVVVGIRLFGVWQFLLAIDGFMTVFAVYFGIQKLQYSGVQVYWLMGIRHTVVGLILFLFAHQLVNIVYRQEQSDPTPNSPPSQGEAAENGGPH